MPYLVRDNLFIGNIHDAVDVLQKGSGGITHVLSLLSTASVSFFSDWRAEVSIPMKEVRKVYVGGSGSLTGSDDEYDGSPRHALAPEKLLYSLEMAGPELKIVKMVVPLRDIEEEDLLDYLDVCLDLRRNLEI